MSARALQLDFIGTFVDMLLILNLKVSLIPANLLQIHLFFNAHLLLYLLLRVQHARTVLDYVQIVHDLALKVLICDGLLT